MQIVIGDNHKIYLSDNMAITPQEKVVIVEELLAKKLDFDGEIMSVEEYFRFTWKKETTKNAQGNLAYYMTYHHRTQEELDLEEENKNSYMKSSNTGILTKNQEKEMETGYYITKDENNKITKKRRYTNFVNLPLTDKNSLGVEQYKDYKDKQKQGTES
jgi:hypothetical protein